VSEYPEHRVLDSQWQSVCVLVERMGFDPGEFERDKFVGTAYNGIVPRLVHKLTKFQFIFDFDEQGEAHAVSYTPGEQSPWGSANGLDWPSVLYWAEHWLTNLKRELATPNLWELLEEQRELLGTTEPTDDSPNTPFNPEEQRQIAARLDEIKELLVSNHGVDPAALDDKLDYLVDASKRTGRVDWRNIFVATIFGLVATT
jgi:hypothetical protein